MCRETLTTCVLFLFAPSAFAGDFTGVGGDLSHHVDEVGFRSDAYGVSPDGGTVVGRTGSRDRSVNEIFRRGNEAFRWDADEGINLIELPRTFFEFGSNKVFRVAIDVSNDGQSVVGSMTTDRTNFSDRSFLGGSSEAFRWRFAGGEELVDDLRNGGPSNGLLSSLIASSISSDGNIAAGFATGVPDHGGDFNSPTVIPLWNDEPQTWVDIDPFLEISKLGYLSPNGLRIAGDDSLAYSPPEAPFPEFKFDHISDPRPDYDEAARAITDDEIVIGFSALDLTPENRFNRDQHGPREAFWWSEAEGFHSLGFLREGDVESVAFDVSNDGRLVVGRSSAKESDGIILDDVMNIDSLATLWTAERGMMSLQEVLVRDYGLGEELVGWTLKAARAITLDGRVVVGGGTNPAGEYEAFRAELELNLPVGDIDFDGDVDLEDFVVLKFNFGSGQMGETAFRDQGNLNNDAVVDLDDFNLLKSSFGTLQAVPEPSGSVLFMMLSMFFLATVTRYPYYK